MKELSVEEKAEHYDEVVNKLRRFMEQGVNPLITRADVQDFFPQLKENEDEKIRKELIGHLRECRNNTRSEVMLDEYAKWISWLEKHGEQKSIWHNEDEEPQRDSLILLIMQSGTPIVAKIIEPNHTFNRGERWAYIDDLLGKQSEQILANSAKTCKDDQKPTDKIEPKFKVGDWIAWKDKCYKVNYNGCGYELVDQDGLSTSLEYGTIDEGAHLWDITEDAKDGDVLSDGTTIFIFKDLLSDGSVMSYCDYDTDSGESDAFCPLSVNLMCSKITPTTNEQRDTLMKAMTDAGYTFNFVKKVLKNIEQEPTDNEMKEALRTEYEKGRADVISEFQKAWSEEDESYLNTTIAYLKDAKEFKKSAENCINWLKSLKDRVQSKPILRRRHTIFDEII